MNEPKWNRDRMAKFLDITPRHLNYLCQNGILPKPVDLEYDAARCVMLYIRYLRDGGNADAKGDRARKLKAEADTAEMEAEQLRGTLCLRSDYVANYRDAVALGVSRISRLKKLTAEQKDLVFAALREVELPPLPELNEAGTQETDDA